MDGEVAVSKVSVRGQTAIPKAVKLYMKLNDGDFIVWKIEDGKITVEKKGEQK
jgi:bifunctional DNA-binding transcriptional regulator/antitoxin component of YhaV-PrlF toxin-antitoxin module